MSLCLLIIWAAIEYCTAMLFQTSHFWLTGNAFTSGVPMLDNLRKYYNTMKHHK